MSLLLYFLACPGIVCFGMVRWLQAAGRYNSFRTELHPDKARTPTLEDVSSAGILGTYRMLDARRSSDDQLVRSGAVGLRPQALLAAERSAQTTFVISMFVSLVLVAVLTNVVPTVASALDTSADAVATAVLLGLGWIVFSSFSIRAARRSVSNGSALYAAGWLAGIVVVGVIALSLAIRIVAMA